MTLTLALIAALVLAAYAPRLRRPAANSDDEEIMRIEDGLIEHEPQAWPVRQRESDVAGAYAPIDSPQAQWPWETGYAPEVERHLDLAPVDWTPVIRKAHAWNELTGELARISLDVRDWLPEMAGSSS